MLFWLIIIVIVVVTCDVIFNNNNNNNIYLFILCGLYFLAVHDFKTYNTAEKKRHCGSQPHSFTLQPANSQRSTLQRSSSLHLPGAGSAEYQTKLNHTDPETEQSDFVIALKSNRMY